MRIERLPVALVATLCALVVVATGNLTGLGIGTEALLYDTVALPRLAIALVLTAAGWAAWLLVGRSGDEQLRVDAVLALLSALAVWACLSAALSPHRALAVLGQSERLEGLTTACLYVLAYGLALQALRTIGDVRVVASFFAVAVVAMAVYGLVQYGGLDPANYATERYGFEVRRAFATFGNPNFLAGLLVLGLPIVGALALDARSTGRRIAWGVGALVTGMALFATFTRGAWLAALVQAFVALVAWHRSGRRVSRTARWMLFAAGAIAVIMLTVSLTSRGELNVVRRLTDRGSASERLLTAEIALRAAAERPLVGHGPDAFLPAFRLHRTAAYAQAFGATATVNNAHSWPLQYAATLGFVGAALLGAVLSVSLWRSRMLVARPRESGSVLMAAIWIGCLGYVVQAMLSVAVLGATVPLWVLLGALGAPRATGFSAKPGVRIGLGVFATVLTLAALSASVVLIRADALYLDSRYTFAGMRAGDALGLAKLAHQLNPTSVKYARGAAQAAQVRVEDAIVGSESPEAVRAGYAGAAAAYARVLRQSPNDYAAHAWLAALQARAGTYLGDEGLMARARRTASNAAALDAQHADVLALTRSELTTQAVTTAASVPPLP